MQNQRIAVGANEGSFFGGALGQAERCCRANNWKELVWQLKKAKSGSLLLSIPLAIIWLALGLGVMLLSRMLVDKIEKLPKLLESLLWGLLYVPMWASIAIAFYGLLKGRSHAALRLRLILMVSFSAIIIAAAAFAYSWRAPLAEESLYI